MKFVKLSPWGVGPRQFINVAAISRVRFGRHSTEDANTVMYLSLVGQPGEIAFYPINGGGEPVKEGMTMSQATTAFAEWVGNVNARA